MALAIPAFAAAVRSIRTLLSEELKHFLNGIVNFFQVIRLADDLCDCG